MAHSRPPEEASSDDKEIPNAFICPINREIMSDPVVTPTGQTYENEAIKSWINSQLTSPLCPVDEETGEKIFREPMTNERIYFPYPPLPGETIFRTTGNFTPNKILKSQIEEWKDKNRRESKEIKEPGRSTPFARSTLPAASVPVTQGNLPFSSSSSQALFNVASMPEVKRESKDSKEMKEPVRSIPFTRNTLTAVSVPSSSRTLPAVSAPVAHRMLPTTTSSSQAFFNAASSSNASRPPSSVPSGNRSGTSYVPMLVAPSRSFARGLERPIDLIEAVQREDIPKLIAYFRGGGSLQKVEPRSNETAFIIATKKKNHSMLKLLCNHVSSTQDREILNRSDCSQNTALHYALDNADLKAAEYLISAGHYRFHHFHAGLALDAWGKFIFGQNWSELMEHVHLRSTSLRSGR